MAVERDASVLLGMEPSEAKAMSMSEFNEFPQQG